MFCHLVSPDPLRRALMLLSDSDSDSDSDSEPPSQAGAVVPPTTPPAALAAAAYHVAVDIPDDDDDDAVDGDDEETGQPRRCISPVCRVLVKAVFVVYATFVAPPLVATAATRSDGLLQELLVVVPALLTVVALFMATVRVVEAEDRERAVMADSQDDCQDNKCGDEEAH